MRGALWGGAGCIYRLPESVDLARLGVLLVASVRCLHVFGGPPQESCRTGPRSTDPLDLFIWGGPLEALWRPPIETDPGRIQEILSNEFKRVRSAAAATAQDIAANYHGSEDINAPAK